MSSFFVILNIGGNKAMEEIINLFLNTGVSIAVIIYFMYRDFKFMTTLQTTLTSLVDAVDTLKLLIKDKEED